MKNLVVVLAVLLLVALRLTSGGGDDDDEVTFAPTPVITPAGDEVSIEASCSDFYYQAAISEEVEVAVGDSFPVTLCSMAPKGFQWIPGKLRFQWIIGFQWSEAQVSDQTVLKQTDHSFVPPWEGAISAAAGQDVWTFKALSEGNSTISMEYRRPWAGDKKVEWTFVLTVTAR